MTVGNALNVDRYGGLVPLLLLIRDCERKLVIRERHKGYARDARSLDNMEHGGFGGVYLN